MTQQESFKKKVRARMQKTGEKYGAARRALLTPTSGGPPPPWVEEPEYDDDSVKKGTGRTWDEWGAIIDAWPEREQGHAAIAARLRHDEVDDAWWSQAVTIGYERIRGLRTKYMRSDGSFAGSISRTIDGDAASLDADLRSPEAHDRLFPELETEVRSRPDSKAVRIAIADAGAAVIAVTAPASGRMRIAVEHAGLGSTDEVEHWKAWWAGWCAARAAPE